MEPWLSDLEPFVTKTEADVEDAEDDNDETTEVEDEEVRWDGGSPPIPDMPTAPLPSMPDVLSWLSPPEVLLLELGFAELLLPLLFSAFLCGKYPAIAFFLLPPPAPSNFPSSLDKERCKGRGSGRLASCCIRDASWLEESTGIP